MTDVNIMAAEEAEIAASEDQKQQNLYKVLPFILSALASLIVKKSYVFTDSIFILLVYVVLILFLVTVFSYAAQYTKWYVSAYEFGTFKFLLSLIIPYYALDIFEKGFSESPIPRWYEGIAYTTIFLVIILSGVSLFTQEFKVNIKNKQT